MGARFALTVTAMASAILGGGAFTSQGQGIVSMIHTVDSETRDGVKSHVSVGRPARSLGNTTDEGTLLLSSPIDAEVEMLRAAPLCGAGPSERVSGRGC